MGAKWNTVCFEKAYLSWVYFHVHLISVIGQYSVTHPNQIFNRPCFEYLTKTKFDPIDKSIYSHFDINLFDKLSNRTTACGSMWLCTSCSHFRIIWLSNGRYCTGHNVFPPIVISGANGSWYLGAKCHHSILPLNVFHLPQCPGQFYLTPTNETFSNEKD